MIDDDDEEYDSFEDWLEKNSVPFEERKKNLKEAFDAWYESLDEEDNGNPYYDRLTDL